VGEEFSFAALFLWEGWNFFDRIVIVDLQFSIPPEIAAASAKNDLNPTFSTEIVVEILLRAPPHPTLECSLQSATLLDSLSPRCA
jgi:hypothetical protein